MQWLQAEGSCQRAVDVDGLLVDVPLLLNRARVDLADQQIFAQCHIRRREHHVRCSKLLSGWPPSLVYRFQGVSQLDEREPVASEPMLVHGQERADQCICAFAVCVLLQPEGNCVVVGVKSLNALPSACVE